MRVRNHFPRLLAGVLFATGLSVLEGQRANADDLATIKQRGTLIVGDIGDTARVRQVTEQSGGNPFWALQCAASLQSNDTSVPQLARSLSRWLAAALSADAASANPTAAMLDGAPSRVLSGTSPLTGLVSSTK